MPHPFFSIILPTYRRPQLLLRALHSVMEQDFTDWELLVIDDEGSGKPPEAKALQTLILQEPKIQWISDNLHRGPEGAKNHGLSLAKGQFLTFLDDDDEYRFDHLALRHQLLMSRTELKFIHGGFQVIGSEWVPDKDHPGQQIHLSECAIGGTFFIRQDLYREMGGFPLKAMGADAHYLESLIKHQIPMEKVSCPTYLYHREEEHSVTKNFSAK